MNIYKLNLMSYTIEVLRNLANPKNILVCHYRDNVDGTKASIICDPFITHKERIDKGLIVNIPIIRKHTRTVREGCHVP